MKTMIGVLAAMVMAGCSVGNADDLPMTSRLVRLL